MSRFKKLAVALAALVVVGGPVALPAAGATAKPSGESPTSSKTSAADKQGNAAARQQAASRAAPLAAGAAAGPAVVTLGFDDGRVSQFDAATTLSSFGFNGTFYLISGSLGQPDYLTVAQAKTMEASGNEIGGHTRTHPDMTEVSTATQTTEICGGRQDLITDGFKTPVSFAYPYGSYNVSAENVAQSCGFTSARSTDDGIDALPPAVPMATLVEGYAAQWYVHNTVGPSLAEMQGWVTSAEQSSTNKWSTLLWHDVKTSTQPGWGDIYYQNQADFVAFLTWLKGEVTAGRVVVKTAGQAMAGTTTATAPGAPSGVAATAGNASATVRWTPPTNTGGSPITGYTVTSAPGGVTATVGGSATSATVSGLTNGTAYTFTVTATNVAGTSPPSAPSTAVTPTATATAPGAPSGVAATAGNASATVRWTPPADNGGSAITGYTVNAYVGANTTVFKRQTAAAGATSLVVTGLTNGTAYTFTVAATNAAGTGALSARSVAVTPGTVPGAPVIGTAVAGTAGGPIEATAKWAPPAATGGSAITGYRVTALRMSGGTVLSSTVSTDQPAASRSLDMTLPVAGNYRFTVQAINAAGAGAASARSNRVAGR